MHREADWVVTGVVIEGAWFPAAPGIAPARFQLRTAGLVKLEELPLFIAPDAAVAAEVALVAAELAGLTVAGSQREAPHSHDYGGEEVSITLDEL